MPGYNDYTDQEKKEVVKKVKYALKEMAMGDIYLAIGIPKTEISKFNFDTQLETGAFLGAFTLGCCLIDAMSHYWRLRLPTEKLEDHFTDFCNNFLKSTDPNISQKEYDLSALYQSLRCALVHNYLTLNVRSGSFVKFYLTHNQRNEHLASDPKENITILNLQNFILDIQQAMETFFLYIDANPENTINWAGAHGFMDVIHSKSALLTITEAPTACYIEEHI